MNLRDKKLEEYAIRRLSDSPLRVGPKVKKEKEISEPKLHRRGAGDSSSGLNEKESLGV